MNRIFSLLASASLIASVTACGGGGGGSANATTSAADTPLAVALDFAVSAAGQAIACGTTLPPMGTSGTAAELTDLRVYISELSLIDGDGNRVPVELDQNVWQYRNVALLDFEDGSGSCANGTADTNTRITGTAPAGTYTGVDMVMGVPVSHTDAAGATESLNHTDTTAAAAPLDIQGMAWSWQAGRKFARIEVSPAGGVIKADGTTASTFNFHLGSTGCTGNPATGETVSCTAPNRMAFHLHDFDMETQKVMLDISKLFESANLVADSGGANGCMSGKTDPECAPIFEAMKVDIDSGESIDAGHGQALFVAAAK